MDKFKTDSLSLRVEKTLDSLQKNNMSAYFCKTCAEARELVKALLKKGDVVSNGGSQTLKEAGIIDLLKSGGYTYLDRSQKDLTPAQIEEIYRRTYSCDVYFTSSNAITETGLLYNVDGNSNRVSAILYGPKSVVVVCGFNKIVPDLNSAVERVKTVAAPPNALRLQRDTYCRYKGECLSLQSENSEICSGCQSDERICCNYVISAYQRVRGRIKVIIIGEELGY